MTWFKLDDKSAFHTKVVRAGNEAWGAVCRAGAWSSDQGTDGFVPDEIASMIAQARVWRKAENSGGPGRAGLVERVEGGWQIHDFLDWNPSAKQVVERRETTRKRVEQWREKHNGNASCNAVTNAVSNTAPVPTRPDPSRSDPDERVAAVAAPPPPASEKRTRTRSVAIPLDPDWHPNADHLAIAKELGHNGSWLSAEAAKMRDWAAAKGSKANCVDWNARFRNWIRDAKAQGASRFSPTPDPNEPDPRVEADRRIAQTNALLNDGRLKHMPRPVRSTEPVAADKAVVASFLSGFGKVGA